MYPSRLPVLYLVQVIGILLCVIVALALLKNPLALLGLTLLPEFPLVPEQPEKEEEEIPLDEYQRTSAGFTPD